MDWKTTLAGLIGAASVIIEEALRSGAVTPRAFMIALGLAALGYLAGDKRPKPPADAANQPAQRS